MILNISLFGSLLLAPVLAQGGKGVWGGMIWGNGQIQGGKGHFSFGEAPRPNQAQPNQAQPYRPQQAPTNAFKGFGGGGNRDGVITASNGPPARLSDEISSAPKSFRWGKRVMDTSESVKASSSE